MRMSVREVDRVILDHGIGQELLAHGVEIGLGLAAVGFLELDLDIFALADILDAGKAHDPQRMLDGASLRVENAGFEGDMDARLHGSPVPDVLGYCIVEGPLRSRGPPSGRIPNRRATS